MTKVADKWFSNVDFVSIADTVKGIMTSDGSMSTLLDFERVLDQCNLYAFKNWIKGELVQGPDASPYEVSCIFMWPEKLMPDTKAAKRLKKVGIKLKGVKKDIEVPIEVKNPDDFIQGTNYPKSVSRKVVLIKITIPRELMDDIKEGSVELANATINTEDLDDAYDEDLDTESSMTQDQQNTQNPQG